jgi:hypothetical protein
MKKKLYTVNTKIFCMMYNSEECVKMIKNENTISNLDKMAVKIGHEEMIITFIIFM